MLIRQSLINLAVEESSKGDHKQKVGCVIFYKKRILSKGHNSSQKSIKNLHPRFQKYRFSVHAEVDAIIKAKTDLRGSSLLVIRINKNNEFRLSKPCQTCLKYIEHVGIKKIFYSISGFPYITIFNKEEK